MYIDKSSQRVGEMFDSIAPTYDLLNRLLSVKRDKFWREQAVKWALTEKPSIVLDIATGTGDMLIEMRKKTHARLIGVDISEKMMQIAQQKLAGYDRVDLFRMQAEKLNFQNEWFDLVTVAFGVRNFESIELAFQEIYRVMKKNGRLVVLEFVKPTNKLMFSLMKLYLKYVIPMVGKIISKNNEAYRYLYETIGHFYTKEEFIELCKKHGFAFLKTKTFNGGLVAIFVLKK